MHMQKSTKRLASAFIKREDERRNEAAFPSHHHLPCRPQRTSLPFDSCSMAEPPQGPLLLLLDNIRPVTLVVSAGFLLYFIYVAAYGTDIPHIRGIPEPAGAVPFYGHIKALGDDHPSTLQEWSVKNGWPLLQAKLGNRRIIVLNTFEAAQHFIQKNASATIDRPIFWTFHKMVSNTQGKLKQVYKHAERWLSATPEN